MATHLGPYILVLMSEIIRSQLKRPVQYNLSIASEGDIVEFLFSSGGEVAEHGLVKGILR